MSSAVIIIDNLPARRIAACGGRISTTEGSALELFNAPADDEKDLKLIRKILSSGHQTVIEHHDLNIAFDNVSVLAEQFIIEHRLASYTVKSRRYVNYTDAGFVMPETLPLSVASEYTGRMEYLFDLYDRMVAIGIPKEDARFILPYCFRSNFYCTMNARELSYLICNMLFGRGKDIPEITRLGSQLRDQFDAIYPGVIEKQAASFPAWSAPKKPFRLLKGSACSADSSLLTATNDPGSVLRDAVRFSGRFDPALDDEELALLLARDARPRELEMLTANFSLSHLSLSCLTHLTRHRMLSLIVPPVSEALAGGDYLVPATIDATDGIRDEYIAAFRDQTEFARKLLSQGLSESEVGYLALSGHQINVRVSMNAREILHFMQLRTCRRAQWEIRELAGKMLRQLQEYSPVYRAFGPSCAILGHCPEGRQSCGRPYIRK